MHHGFYCALGAPRTIIAQFWGHDAWEKGNDFMREYHELERQKLQDALLKEQKSNERLRIALEMMLADKDQAVLFRP